MRKRLLGKRLHCVFDGASRLIGLWFELFVEQRGKLVALKLNSGETGCTLGFGSHYLCPFLRYALGVSLGFGADDSEDISAGSCNTFDNNSSAPDLPSMYDSKLCSCVRASSS